MVVVGVGQELRGDDGAGPAVIRRLADLTDGPPWLVINAAHAPENCLRTIARFCPDVILFIDAARSGGAPGQIVWLPAEEADSVGGSTHTLSLAMLGRYLSAETGASVYVLAIQPVKFGLMEEGLSPSVAEAADRVADALAGYWRDASTASSAMVSGDRSVVSI